MCLTVFLKISPFPIYLIKNTLAFNDTLLCKDLRDNGGRKENARVDEK